MAEQTVSTARLRKHVTELTGTDPDSGIADLGAVAATLGDARIVGLGESTHGTREFFEFKRRILRLLVEELGYRLVGLEAEFAEAMPVATYVVHGEGDPEEALERLDFWPWHTESMLALIEWLREFNAGRPLGDRVRLYGIDAQSTEAPAAAVREYLDTVDPASLDGRRDVLESLEAGELKDGWDVDAESLDNAEALVAELAARFDASGEAYAAATSANERRKARHHLRTLSQAVETARRIDDADEPYFAAGVRDRWMADNVEWMLEHHDADSVALWSHNGHVMKGGTDGSWPLYDPMGRYLTERFGDDYYALALEFGHGTVSAQPPTWEDEDQPVTAYTVGTLHEEWDHDELDREDRNWSGEDLDEPWLSERLAGIDAEGLFLDVDAAIGDDGLESWLERRQLLHSIGTVFLEGERANKRVEAFRLPQEVDGLLFVDESSHTAPVE